jgi:glycerol-1-phosphate dehydrogenase [NAD(P)+]
MEVQLCNQVGHARPEEGSEHYFAYCAEQFTGPAWPHADLLGPGILHMTKLQGQDSHPVEIAMNTCHILLDRIPAEVVERTLLELPEYCKERNLLFGIAHKLSDRSG